jgi:hypothetical protein
MWLSPILPYVMQAGCLQLRKTKGDPWTSRVHLGRAGRLQMYALTRWEEWAQTQGTCTQGIDVSYLDQLPIFERYYKKLNE